MTFSHTSQRRLVRVTDVARRGKKGSNQYQTKRRGFLQKKFGGLKIGTWFSIAVVVIPVTVITANSFNNNVNDSIIQHKDRFIQEVVAQGKPQAVPTVIPLAPLPEREANIALIKKVWGKDASIGLAIAKCESGYRTHAQNVNTNSSVDQGIFQVNSIHGMPEMFNAVANISYAYTKFLEQGTGPWDSSKHCWEGQE